MIPMRISTPPSRINKIFYTCIPDKIMKAATANSKAPLANAILAIFSTVRCFITSGCKRYIPPGFPKPGRRRAIGSSCWNRPLVENRRFSSPCRRAPFPGRPRLHSPASGRMGFADSGACSRMLGFVRCLPRKVLPLRVTLVYCG